MNARDFALHLLDQKTLPGWAMRPRPVEAGPPLPPADPRDYALAENIAVGVVKNLIHLQMLVGHYSGRPLADINPLVQKILAVGMYQLRFLDRVPEHAAVDEAVNQTKRMKMERAAGFVNAVLRNILRDPVVKPPLPTAQQDPRRYAELVLSCPPVLYNRLVTLMGPADALKLCRLNNEETPTLVRLTPGVTIGDLAADGVRITPHERPGMAVVDGANQRHFADWSERNLAQVQDATAAAVVDEMDVRPGMRVMDRCSGMGTKTMQLVAAVGNTGHVTAVDPAAARATALRKLLKHRGISHVTVIQQALLGKPGEKLFDRILVDAPCSNSGVLSRRPEARFAQDDDALRSVEALQDSILADTSAHVAPGGLLVYSTCSIWPSENRGRVDSFVKHRPDFKLVTDRVTLPSLDGEPAKHHDGGYFAVLEKKK